MRRCSYAERFTFPVSMNISLNEDAYESFAEVLSFRRVLKRSCETSIVFRSGILNICMYR